MELLLPSTLSFLKGLRKNNNKEWFEANRQAYLEARENFSAVVQQIIDGISQFDSDIKEIDAKKSIFRLNRDIRFSNDKTPYKTNFGASMSRGGRKSNFAGYYIHIEPGGKSFAGGGLWMPEAPDIKKIRQEIDYSLKEFKSIVESKPFKTHFKGLEDVPEFKLSRIPKGYENENPAAEYLKFKSLIATRELTDEEVVSKRFVSEVVKSYKVLYPLVKFINRSLD